MKKLLVTGISGFLAWFIARHPQQEWQITGCYHQNKPSDTPVDVMKLDLTKQELVQEAIDTLQPDAILHLAAASLPNFCEQHPEISKAVNLDASLHLARLAATRQIPFVFTSTDLVFDGLNPPYQETDPVCPVSVYGRHKAAAESGILQSYPAATIARMPLMYSTNPAAPSFLTNWLAALREGRKVYAFTDEIRTPLNGVEAARGLFLLLDERAEGIWHLGGPKRLSRYEHGCQYAQEAGLSTDLIIPSLQKEVDMPAARPPDVSLDSRKMRARFKWS